MPGRNWSVELSKSALRSLERLPESGTRRILDRLERLGESANPLLHKDVRALEGKLKSFYRIRVGEYRVIFELDGKNKRIGVLAIAGRGNAY